MATRHRGLGGEGPCQTAPCSPPQGANVPHSPPALLWPCRHWALPWLCDTGHCPLGAHMDSWTNRKCCFLWKAALDSFSPSRQLWGSMPATPPCLGGGAPHGSSLESVEQTGNRGPSLSALPGASPWGKLWGPHKEEASESSGPQRGPWPLSFPYPLQNNS